MYRDTYIHTCIDIGGACGVMFNAIGNGHSDPSSNPGAGCLHFT